jgi:alkylhydroperoxidase family enzyme
MFLEEPRSSVGRDRLYQEDIAEDGYVANLTRTWAWHPDLSDGLFDLLDQARVAGDLSLRERALLVTSAASGLGDSYCSLAWGTRLAEIADVDTAVEVVRQGQSARIPEEEALLVQWGRLLATDPNSTTREHIAQLRQAGYDDGRIMAMTVWAALRIAFAIVNDALGSEPDAELVERAPDGLVQAIDFGRPAAG